MLDISGRVRVLRKEISELRLANQLSTDNHYLAAVGERQRMTSMPPPSQSASLDVVPFPGASLQFR